MSPQGTFESAQAAWLSRLGHVRNTVRQEVIARYLARHWATNDQVVLDIGAGQGTQTLRLARVGNVVTALEPDDDMRQLLEAAAQAEPESVRSRVTVLGGAIDDLPGVLPHGDGFDAVLLLGVLMYLAAPTAAVAKVAEQVRPGGMAAVAFRTPVSAVWRPAAREDWAATLAALTERSCAAAQHRPFEYVNEIGARAWAIELSDLTNEFEAGGLHLEAWYGVRVAVDGAEEDPPAPRDPHELKTLVDVEETLGTMDPFRHLGQLCLAIYRRPADDDVAVRARNDASGS